MPSSPRFSEKQIHSIVRRLRDGRQDWDRDMRVRRMLWERYAEAYVDGNGTGTNVTAPFHKSSLIIKSLGGDVVQGLQQYTEIVSSNAPRVIVPPVSVDSDTITKRIDTDAAKQERLLMTLWDNAGGRKSQRKVTWSAMWGRVGWYRTAQRDRAFGMPERTFYGDMSDDELQALKDAGKATPEPIQNRDGLYSYAESGEAYMERRKQASRNRALSARSLFTLEAFPPDVVYPAYDSDGVKYAAAILEIPSLDCGPGSQYAQALHKRTGSTEDPAKYGLYYDRNRKQIVGGVTQGGEETGSGETWTFTIFETRDETYYLVGSGPDSIGTLVAYAEHDFGDCPFVPAPAYHTDSSRPGYEYSSPMEAVFALASPLNQAMTFVSNIMAFNAMARWVLVREDGKLVPDPDTGDPMILTSDSAIGLDPNVTEVVAGTPMQLKIDGEFVYKVVEFYSEKMRAAMPSQAATGQEGATTAWGLKQQIAAQFAVLQQPVDNHAEAVKAVMSRWIHALRAAKTRGEIDQVYAFALPSKRRDARSVRGLVEFDPERLVDSIIVRQSSATEQAKVVNQQMGIEALAAGVTTRRKMLEDYFEAEDARADDIEIVGYDLAQFVLYGDVSKVQQDSVLFELALMLRGRIQQRMLQLSPQHAISTAESMAMRAQEQFLASQQSVVDPAAAQATEGNVAEAAGMREAGMGMGMDVPEPAGVL